MKREIAMQIADAIDIATDRALSGEQVWEIALAVVARLQEIGWLPSPNPTTAS
jgi:hypothetical protein